MLLLICCTANDGCNSAREARKTIESWRLLGEDILESRQHDCWLPRSLILSKRRCSRLLNSLAATLSALFASLSPFFFFVSFFFFQVSHFLASFRFTSRSFWFLLPQMKSDVLRKRSVCSLMFPPGLDVVCCKISFSIGELSFVLRHTRLSGSLLGFCSSLLNTSGT